MGGAGDEPTSKTDPGLRRTNNKGLGGTGMSRIPICAVSPPNSSPKITSLMLPTLLKRQTQISGLCMHAMHKKALFGIQIQPAT